MVRYKCEKPTLTLTDAWNREICCPKIVTKVAPVDAKFIGAVLDIDGLLYENASEMLPIPLLTDTRMEFPVGLPADVLHNNALAENQIETSQEEIPNITLEDA